MLFPPGFGETAVPSFWQPFELFVGLFFTAPRKTQAVDASIVAVYPEAQDPEKVIPNAAGAGVVTAYDPVGQVGGVPRVHEGMPDVQAAACVTAKVKHPAPGDAAAAGLASESMMTGAVHAAAPATAALLIIVRRLRPRESALSVMSGSLDVGGTAQSCLVKILPEGRVGAVYRQLSDSQGTTLSLVGGRLGPYYRCPT
jgi:hypothetical protein